MKQNLKVLYIITAILIFVGIINYFFQSDDVDYPDEFDVIDTFELPNSLREISGISHINNKKIACIQDEDGILFIYDLEKRKVVDEILFGPRGDYESIRILDSDAYVMESNGKLYKINDFESDSRKIEIYDTGFDYKNDIESFDYSKKSNKFLTTPKENNISNKNDNLTIYKINFKDYKVEKKFYSKIEIQDSINKSKVTNNDFHPSELTIHPETEEIYILDSKIPGLLIINSDGSFKILHKLNPEDFQQPEGMSFDSEGKMYISNEENNFLKQNIQLVEWK